jgi:beta-glucanase (GH16 family)
VVACLALALAVYATAVAALATAQAAAAPSCGTTIYKSTGAPWQCTFGDDFNGTSLDTSKWIAQQTSNSGYTSGLTACFVNSRNNISVSSGTLKLTARKESAPFTCNNPAGSFKTQYTSGMVSTYGRFSQTYGRFEVRAKVPPTSIPGLQESFWLWPVNPLKYGPWPGSGEIDIAEIYSQYNDRAIPYIHYNPSAVDPNVTNNWCMISDVSTYHSYAVEWTPQTISVIYDGQTCLVDNWQPASGLVKPAPFDHPFMIALTQALGIGTNAFDPATTPLPATTTVDYVRVWS